jgi:threonine 3-dehydrogenase
MIEMSAAMMRIPKFVGQGRVEWGEREIPVPGPGQLLLQVKANALCGSERGQFYQGTETTPGHEAAGVVTAVGPNTQIEIGTPGVVFLMDYCGACRSCKLGFTNQCLNKRGDMGFNKDGGYGPYMVVNENIFFPVDHDLPLSEATMLLDIMGTGGHAIKRGLLVHPDVRSILVAGAGPIGLGVLAMAKILLGDSVPVYITDMVPYRLELAEKLGGIAINLAANSLDEALQKSGVAGIDLAIDTTGKSVARKASLNALLQRGVLVCVGHGEGLELTISSDMIAPERAVLGSEYFAYSEIADNLPLLKEHFEYLGTIITHRFSVDELQHAFELFFGKGETGKVLIEQ